MGETMGRMLVTGGTGTLGSHVVPLLVAAGQDVRVLSRRAGATVPDDGVELMAGDLATGEGIAAALAGVDVVLHLAGNKAGDDATTATLVDAARQAGTPHLVYVSVVGAGEVPLRSRFERAAFGYFEDKRAAELVVERSGLPWTTLRATQFHDFVHGFARAVCKLPVVPVPSDWKVQPVAAEEVAARMVELALGEPAGRAPDLAGPEVRPLRDFVRGYLEAAGRRRLMLPVRVPGRAARVYAAGVNLAPDRAVGKQTWDEFLAERYPGRRGVRSRSA
jgi:uncharacterized protein YbjT (DUF2867 family)